MSVAWLPCLMLLVKRAAGDALSSILCYYRFKFHWFYPTQKTAKTRFLAEKSPTFFCLMSVLSGIFSAVIKMMMMMSRLVMFARSYTTNMQSRACWWYALMNSSVFRSRRNEDGRWQLRTSTGREFHMGDAITEAGGKFRTFLDQELIQYRHSSCYCYCCGNALQEDHGRPVVQIGLG